MPDAPSFDDLDAAAIQRALAALLAVGTSIIDELKAPSTEITLAARAAAYDRVSLAVRRTILLARHIAENATTPEARRVIARKQILRAVDDTIDDCADPADAENLRVELVERIDSPEFDLDLAHRSPGELIQELCRDLGLANIPGVLSFRRRTPDDIAILCAQAAAPAGSGLPQWIAATADQAAQNDQHPETPDFRLEDRRHL